MLKFLAKRRHNAIDCIEACIATIAVVNGDFMFAALVILVGGLISVTIEHAAGNET